MVSLGVHYFHQAVVSLCALLFQMQRGTFYPACDGRVSCGVGLLVLCGAYGLLMVFFFGMCLVMGDLASFHHLVVL